MNAKPFAVSEESPGVEAKLGVDEHGRFCGVCGESIDIFDELFGPKVREQSEPSKPPLER